MNEINGLTILFSNAIDRIRIDIGDKNNFIQMIDQIPNFTDKLKILLQFLSTDFPIRKLFYNSNKINDFLSQIYLITNECPPDFESFMKWLPNFIFNKNKTIISIQKRVSSLQKHIRELLEYITTFNISGNIKGFKEKESKIFSDLDLLGDNEEIKYENSQNQSKTDFSQTPIINDIPKSNNKNNKINNEELLNLLFQVESLNKRNEQFQIQIENYKLKTDNLLKELSSNENLKQKISELETANLKLKKIYDQNESKYLSTIASLKQKLQKQNQIIQSQIKNQEESTKSTTDLNFEINQLKFSLENTRKEIEIYKNHFNDLRFIFQDQNSNENDQNSSKIEIQSRSLKEKIFQLIEENQQLKNELQQFQNLSSSSIFETIDRLRSQNEELKKSFLQITQNKLNSIKENVNNGKILKSISTSTSSAQLNDINNDSYSSPNNNSIQFSFLPPSDQNILIVQEKDNEINSLKRKIVSLETEKIKLSDSLKKFQVKKNPEKNILDLKKIGFLLADALSQRYNPSRVPFEINRLIEVARSEHIKLCESARVPIDPFDCFVNDPKVSTDENVRTNNNQKKNLFSGFDELDIQISAIKSYV